MDRDEFMSLLGETVPTERIEAAPLPPEPLPEDPSRFYAAGAIPDDLAGAASQTVVGAALARRLGKFPFWRGREVLMDFLERAYLNGAQKAKETLEGK